MSLKKIGTTRTAGQGRWRQLGRGALRVAGRPGHRLARDEPALPVGAPHGRGATVAIRDSKNPGGGHLTLDAADWKAFRDWVKHGSYDQ